MDCLACLLAESEDLKDDGTAEDDDPAEDENDGEPDWAVGDLEPDDWAYPTIDYPTDAAEAQTAPLIGL